MGEYSGVLAIIGTFSALVNLFAVISALGGLIAMIIEQVTHLFNQYNTFLSVFTGALYFHNLGNNLSTISYIANNNFEEEGTEVLFGYYFLS